MDASSSSAPASSAAVRRLRRDLEVLCKSGNPQILVRPAEENLLEWHFLLHSLPDDTPYSEGCYHGKVIFPSEYPHAPPAILMMTPSGRLETRKRLCLSMTDFHPESWNPAWSVETILVGLLSFFISEERGYGSMNASREERVRLARQSRRSNAEDELFRQLFPEYVERTEADSPETCGSVTADERPETAAERAEDAEDAEDLEAANSRRPSVSEGSEGVAECWICRDVTEEPLIQPCRCRGSMSGVHASCVEEWIRRHRRSARDDAPPRCSVCHQPYQGSERVPGVRDFVSHNCRAGAAQCGRVLVLFGLLMLYQECAMDGNLLTPLRALGVTFVALVTIYRLWVLFVSLPQHRAPPQHWLLQRLFVPGQQELAKHLAEAMSFVTVLTVWVIAGLISWPFAVPYALAAAALAAKLGLGRQAGWRCLPTRDCLVRSLRAALCILVSPLILIWATGEFLWRYPRALHPLGPAPHLAFAIAVIPMAWTLQSNLPLLILWGTHVTFIVGGLVELFCLKRWQWKRGLAWVIVLQVTLIGCYISNICVFPKGVGNRTQSAILVLGTSCSWLLLVLMLALKINWELCRQYYRTWQRRHGSFTLDAATPEPA